MILPTPAAPFNRIKALGDIYIDVSGNELVLFTGHPDILTQYNEYTLAVGHTLPPAGTYALTNDYDTSTGILNLQRNWIALYDSTSDTVNFFMFSYKPTKLQFAVNSSGYITQLVLNAGNGVIYHGQLHYSNLTRDSNSNLIPDVLDSTILGSLPNFLKPYISIDGTPGVFELFSSDGQYFLTSDGYTLFIKG